ncbi:ATPase, T2SS/T4P/T4SS family [Methanospirillum stamsii]|nr:ATPase, T2SS/T4P/T4SS family [Methanospirillum stamsii]
MIDHEENYLTGGVTLRASYDLPGIPVQVHIHDTPSGRKYTITEPLFIQDEQDAYEKLILSLKIQLKNPQTYKRFQQNYHDSLQSFITDSSPDVNISSIEKFTYYLTRDMKGFGPLQPYLDDPYIVRLSLQGLHTPAIIEHQQYGLMISGFIPDEQEYYRIIKKAENRSGKKVDPTVLPAVLPLKEGVIQIGPSEDKKSNLLKIDFLRPRTHSEGEKKELQKGSHIISVSSYLNGLAIAKLVTYDDNSCVFLAGFSGFSNSEKKIIQDIKNRLETGKPEKLSGKNFKDRIFSCLGTSHPHVDHSTRQKIVSRIILEKNRELWVRLFLTDPHIHAIVCPGPEKKIRIIHEQYSGPVFTNIELSYDELEKLASFFSRAGKNPKDHMEGSKKFRFKGGLVVSIDQIPEKKHIKITIHSSRTGDVISGPQTDSAQDKEKYVFQDPKTDEILSKVFDLKEQNNKLKDENKNQEEGCPDEKNTGNWKNRFKSLSFRFPQAGLRRRKQKPGPDDNAPTPKEPQVKSVLDVQVPEGLVAEEAYWLVSPHAYVVILKDPAGDRIYRIIEPDLTPRERIVLEETHETLRDVLIYDKPVSKGDLFLDFEEAAKVIKTYDPNISDDRLSVLYYYLKRNLNGYGKIDPLMHDELLEDISCNGHHLPVYVHHRFYSSMPTSVIFDQEELNRFVLKLSQKADKQVSLTSPLLDAALPNGSRAQITYSNVVSTKGSSFTIRKFRTDPMTPITLLGFGTYDPDLLAFLWLALENRKSLIVVGGTASGKTSAMNALSFFIPHNSKIVSLEDTRELQIPHRNWLPVQTRESAAMNERGNINLFDLLKASLRQRPEYIIVGEVRGNEAQTLFQAMNSGHTTISTLHAGNIEEALNRLTNEPINVPPAMFGALDLMVIQTFHYRNGRMIRRCDAVHEIILKEDDKLGWNTLFEYNPVTDGFDRKYNQSKTLETLKYMHNWTEQELLFQLGIRKEFLTRIKNQPRSDPVHLMQLITRLRRMA